MRLVPPSLLVLSFSPQENSLSLPKHSPEVNPNPLPRSSVLPPQTIFLPYLSFDDALFSLFATPLPPPRPPTLPLLPSKSANTPPPRPTATILKRSASWYRSPPQRRVHLWFSSQVGQLSTFVSRNLGVMVRSLHSKGEMTH
ncbi:hypothetical protein Sjap_015396 [Stephania japonica]|uniref:Uncharacterized protein n=1 Tax=Stephania japonica TaxID=461633 RepID=A0AAP0IJ17_9MAGN